MHLFLPLWWMLAFLATVPAATPVTATTATAKASSAQTGQQIAVDPLSPEELKQMLSQSQNSEDDDCLMCGS